LARQRRAEAPPVEKIAVVSAGGAKTLLDYDAVYWIEADGDYSRVHTYDRAYLATSSLRELEELLPAGRFARIHRSHVVNLAKVAAVRRGAPDRIRLALDDKEQTELDVARRQTRALLDRPPDALRELLQRPPPAFRLGSELETMYADVDRPLEVDDPSGVLAGPAADAGEEGIAVEQPPQLAARLLGHACQLGPRDDRRQRSVDVQQDRR